MDRSKLVIAPGGHDGESEFLSLLRQHHYLGVPCKTDESVLYAAVLQGR